MPGVALASLLARCARGASRSAPITSRMHFLLLAEPSMFCTASFPQDGGFSYKPATLRQAGIMYHHVGWRDMTCPDLSLMARACAIAEQGVRLGWHRLTAAVAVVAHCHWSAEASLLRERSRQIRRQSGGALSRWSGAHRTRDLLHPPPLTGLDTRTSPGCRQVQEPANPPCLVSPRVASLRPCRTAAVARGSAVRCVPITTRLSRPMPMIARRRQRRGAVQTRKQEAFVAAYYEVVRGAPAPPKPPRIGQVAPAELTDGLRDDGTSLGKEKTARVGPAWGEGGFVRKESSEIRAAAVSPVTPEAAEPGG